MKKIVTLCMSLLLLGSVAQAQIVTDETLDERFVFTDLQGYELDNGAVIVVNEVNQEGQMVVPVMVKNISGEKMAVSLYEDIARMPNGGWQTCAFGNCMSLTASGYSPKNIVADDFLDGIQTEWMPATYGTWEAKLQIHVFNITQKKQFNKWVDVAGEEIIGYGPVITVRFEYKDPDAQPEPAAQLRMGPYLSNTVAESQAGLGLTNVPGTLGIGVVLPAEDFMMYDGGKVVKMRVGLANAAPITRVFISGYDGTGIVEIMSQDVSLGAAGWNEVELTQPLELDFQKYSEILIGYDYTQSTNGQSMGSYPISMVEEGTKTYSTLTYGPLGQNGKIGWYDIGLRNYGNCSVQCVVESNNFPEKDLVLGRFITDANWYKNGTELAYAVDIQNCGISEVGSFSYDVEIDNQVVSSVSSEKTIASLETVAEEGVITVPTDLARGSHKLSLRLKSVDGAAPVGNIDNDYVSTPFSVFEQSVARQKNLLEQFTSQYCTYCPRGVTIFSDLNSERDDIAWVSVHGNMSGGSDVFTIAAGDTISYYQGVTGFPQASINRSYIPALASGDSDIAYGLGFNMQYRKEIVEMFHQLVDFTAEPPSFVTLGISQVYDPSTRELDITVDGQGVKNAAEVLDGEGLTVMLTENSLVARQLNEGSWVNNFEHHYVLRAVLGKCTGNAISWEGDNFTAHFTYTIPEGCVKDNMYVVAFVAPMVTLGATSTKEMAVNNCEMVAVKDAIPAAIQNVNADQTGQSRYTLDGRQMPKAQRGLNIVRMADGSVKKMVVK